MPTRLFTAFMMPNDESVLEDKVKYWIDVEENYDRVFAMIYPINQPASNLELHASFRYTKLGDGRQFSCVPTQIMGFEEID